MFKRLPRILGIALLGLIALFAALVAWPVAEAPRGQGKGDLVIDNVRVVDVESGTAGEPVSITVRGGRIAAIGEAPAVTGGIRIDAGGGFAIPGLWDMHVHTFQTSPQLHLPLWTANGVTSVRDMMDCPEETDSLIACAEDKRGWNRAVEAGRMTAPRIVETASFYLESPDITPAEARARVQEYGARGLDAVKVYNRLSPAAYRAAAGEAKRRKMRLVGHLPQAVPLGEAIAAGQASFEHAHLFARECSDRPEDWRAGRLEAMAATARIRAYVAGYEADRCAALFAQMREAGAWFVPTHVTREEDARAADPAFASDPRLDYLDPLSRYAWEDDLGGTRGAYPGVAGERALQAYFEHGLKLTGAAHDAGVNVLVGTDTAIGGFRYHDELALLVRAGMTPAEVLKAATIDAARYAGEEGNAGSIAVGKRADIVLLEGDPLDDIANTRRIRAVVQGGRLYDRDRLDAVLAFVKRQAGAPHNWAKLVWGFARSSVASEL